MQLNRRTYLKAGALSTLAIGGVVGTNVAAENATSGSGGRTAPAPGGGSAPGAGGGCPAGTTLLAKYEWKGDGFVLAEGDGSAVAIVPQSVVTDGDGEPVAFTWTATRPVAVVSVKYGQEIARFDGGLSGAVDLREAQFAISNVSFCAARGGRGVLCQLDVELPNVDAFDVETHVDNGGCPSLGPSAVHVTSPGGATRDYAHGMATLGGRLEDGVTLGDLTGVSFAFGAGAANQGAVPDEVYASLLTPGDELRLAITHAREDGTANGSCETGRFDVLDAMENGNWSVIPVSVASLRTSTMAEETARVLRGTDRSGSLLPRFADATLVGVGFGAGNTRRPTVIDRYYDDLQVSWDGDSASFDFPAVVPMDCSFDPSTVDGGRGGSVSAALSFRQAESGLSLADVDAGSVKLTGFSNVVPPVEPGVAAQRVRVDGGRLVATFRQRAVADLLGEGTSYPVVSGDFAVSSGSSFVGIGSLSVE